MKKKFPLPLIIIAVLVVGYMIASLILNNYLSEDRLRLMLIEPAEAQLGRKVDIGAIDVSFFSGINIENIKIHGNDPSEDFLTINSFRLKYQFIPLLQKKLVITEVLIDQPALKLLRNSDGVFNFADISMKPKKIEKENLPPQEDTVDPLPLALIFEKITVNNFSLAFMDQTGELPDITSSKGDLLLSLTLADNLADSTFRGTLKLIANADYNDHKPVLILNCDLNEKQIGFKGDLTIELEKLSFSGLLTDLQRTPMNLNLNLQSNSLDIDRLAAMKPVSVDNPKEPSIEAVPPRSEKATQLSSWGKIRVSNLNYKKIALKNLKLDYVFKDGQLVISDINFGIFGGEIAGQAKADFSQTAPDFSGDISAENLKMANAMTSLDKPAEYLSGDLNASLTLHGVGQNWPEIRNNLEGHGKFSLLRGGLASSPYSQALATLLDIPELNQLNFEELAGNLEIAAGRVSLLAAMTSSEMDLQTKGSIGLDGNLDLPMTIQLSRENSQRLLEKSKYTGYLADESGRTTLNLKMSGEVNKPKLTLDSSGAGKQVKKVLEKKAGEELSRAINKQLGGSGKEQQKDVVEDLSNRFLKQLLDN